MGGDLAPVLETDPFLAGPPRWNPLDWWDEARAEASLAACAAALDYDPSRGVPRAAFLYERILAGVWTRYRQEWAYGRYLRPRAPWKNGPRRMIPPPPPGTRSRPPGSWASSAGVTAG